MKKVLSIAGSDCSGGAGIQADLKTFSAHGVFGMSVIVSVVAENTSRVIDIQDITPDMIEKQIDAVFEDIEVDAVKIGKIREDYLADSTVTIYLIGEYSAENSFLQDQTYIKRELQASLYNGENNTKNGILGIVLPSMYDKVYKGKEQCSVCGKNHNIVCINDNTTIKEFSYNYYIPKESGCSWSEDERYCVLVKWEDFKNDPETYIDNAFNKRKSEISKKTKVRPQKSCLK